VVVVVGAILVDSVVAGTAVVGAVPAVGRHYFAGWPIQMCRLAVLRQKHKQGM